MTGSKGLGLGRGSAEGRTEVEGWLNIRTRAPQYPLGSAVLCRLDTSADRRARESSSESGSLAEDTAPLTSGQRHDDTNTFQKITISTSSHPPPYIRSISLPTRQLAPTRSTPRRARHACPGPSPPSSASTSRTGTRRPSHTCQSSKHGACFCPTSSPPSSSTSSSTPSTPSSSSSASIRRHWRPPTSRRLMRCPVPRRRR